ncbi:MAG: C1 family peptidase [Candidatus Dormibacteria bacterium]
MATQLHGLTIARYGWRRDLPDPRDFSYPTMPSAWDTPTVIDLRDACPPVSDQGESAACTAYALLSLFQYQREATDTKLLENPSAMHLYWKQREEEGTSPHDVGAQFRTGLKLLHREGVTTHDVWDADSTKPTKSVPETTPPRFVYYRLPQSLHSMKRCLSEGYPFVFGFSVFSNMESDRVSHSGNIPLPRDTDMLLGGHAATIVGYNDLTQQFTIQNTWGEGWGDCGYGYIPYSYVLDTNLATDFWTIRTEPVL